MLTHILLRILSGFFLGYVIASWSESFFHQHIGHASPRLRRFWERYPLIGTPFLAAFYCHHIIHHSLTFRKDFVTQFESEEERLRLNARIPAHWLKSVVQDDYGLTLRGAAKFLFVAPITPFVPVIYLLFGPWVLLGASIPMFFIYPMMSKWLHPLIHKAEEGLLHTCTPLEQRIMNSWYMKLVLRDHFLHHEYVNCNYNLLRGGDYMRFVHRDATTDELATMKRIGLQPERVS